MEVLDVIRKLIDKQTGAGISKTTIGRYCGYTPTAFNYYLNRGIPLNDNARQAMIQGLRRLQEDINKIIDAMD